MKKFIVILCLICLAVPVYAEVSIKKEIKERYNRDVKYCNKIHKILENNYYSGKTVTNKYKVTTVYNITKESYQNEVETPWNEMVKCLRIKYSFLYDIPVLNSDQSYYDANQKIDDLINNRKLYCLKQIQPYRDKDILLVYYNDLGQINKIDKKKLTYNQDGSLKKLGLLKLKYNRDDNYYYNSYLLKIKLNSKNEIYSLRSTAGLFESIFKVEDTLELYEYYQKMLADQFFSKYKYYGPRYELYTSFFLLNVEGKSDIINAKTECDLKFAKFFRFYLAYVHVPMIYDKLSDQEKLWFLSQVVETQNWMKMHKVNYKNPYEERFRTQMRTVKKNSRIPVETEKERLQKEIDKLNKQINEQQKELNNLKDRQNIRIRSIDGQSVQYDSNGRIYSIGGKQVQY